MDYSGYAYETGGLGDGAPLVDRIDYRGLAAQGFVVVAFNAHAAERLRA